MPVSINSLINNKEEQKVRSIVTVGGEVVKIFEPTMDQLKEIVDIQERWVKPESSEVAISGEDLIRILFPMLTDLEELANLSDEKVREIVENPSLLFLQVQYELEAIISEVYVTLLAANKRNISHLDLEFGLQKQTTDTIERMVANAPADTRNKIIKLSKELEDMKSQQGEVGNNLDDNNVENEVYEEQFVPNVPELNDKSAEHKEKLNSYLERFAENE